MQHVHESWIAVALLAFGAAAAWAQEQPAPFGGGYKPLQPRKEVPEGALAVTAPGNCAEAGKTYILMNDIASEMTPLFLGQDVTLDLNGHTVTFAAGPYEHVSNYGFEEGLKDWDVSKAPGAKVLSTIERPLVGSKFCLLPQGEELVSKFVTLPIANRSYYATCVLSHAGDWKGRTITLVVEDEQGAPVECEFKGGKTKRVGGTIENQGAELGGGTIFTHLHHLPAGKYRLRVKAAAGACQIDECDIRPALDAGIAIAGKVAPYATYADAIKQYPCAFFDYTKKDTTEPLESIPLVKGAGTVTIRNGTVRSGYPQGIRSWGIHCSAGEVRLALDNVRVENSGINANAVAAGIGKLENCTFEVNTPYIINRHDTSEMPVKLEKAGAEVARCLFSGGQGNLSCWAGQANIHDNLFVNEESVTNHYSISPGSGDKIYNNRFEPKRGNGIYIGSSKGVEVYDNVFRICTPPPNSEYRYASYSANAVRLSDYNSKPGSAKVCTGNKVYRNKIYVTGLEYPEFKGYTASVHAFFISVGGGTNYIYDNEIFVENKNPETNHSTYAFYIGSSDNSGEIYHNKITGNCPVAWIGCNYGSAANALFHGNTFVKAPGTLPGCKAFVLGDGGNTASDIGFYSNTFEGWGELFDIHTHSFSYTMGWTLTAKVAGLDGKPARDVDVSILDKDGKEVVKTKTNAQGAVSARLAEYTVNEKGKTICSAYTVKAGGQEEKIVLDKDLELMLRLRQ